GPSSAPDAGGRAYSARVLVTHRFHPLFGRQLEFVKRRKNWDQDRVYVCDEAGALVSLPVEWTDVVAEDPFVVVAAGRAPFHVARLLELADLVARLSSGDAPGVMGIVP
ncbi:DUF5372 family protein, partial [Mycobacterium sp.]|uniref:DUF5372 family protein n=1 Tax=Mycobacterium sp. TaxID=1785 RepID=UPI003C745F7F